MKPGELSELTAGKLRDKTADELRGLEKELRGDLFWLRIHKSMGQLDGPGKVRDARRDLARVKTILREKQTA